MSNLNRLLFSVIAECSPEGTIKLVNGSSPSEGRLEVCIRGVWGTVSDDRWDSISASTVCKILGFSSQGQSININVHHLFCNTYLALILPFLQVW